MQQILHYFTTANTVFNSEKYTNQSSFLRIKHLSSSKDITKTKPRHINGYPPVRGMQVMMIIIPFSSSSGYPA